MNLSKNNQLKKVIVEQSSTAIKNLIFLAEKARKQKNKINYKEEYLERVKKHLT